MKTEISEEVLKKTTCCRKNNSCLKGELKHCCKIISCINNEVHFVEPADEKYCEYQKMFGYSCYCNCPVRKEIYRKYKL